MTNRFNSNEPTYYLRKAYYYLKKGYRPPVMFDRIRYVKICITIRVIGSV